MQTTHESLEAGKQENSFFIFVGGGGEKGVSYAQAYRRASFVAWLGTPTYLSIPTLAEVRLRLKCLSFPNFALAEV